MYRSSINEPNQYRCDGMTGGCFNLTCLKSELTSLHLCHYLCYQCCDMHPLCLMQMYKVPFGIVADA